MELKVEKWCWWGLFLVGLILRLKLILTSNIDYDETFTIKILHNCGPNWICLIKSDPSVPPLQYLWFALVAKLSVNNLVVLRLSNGIIFWIILYWLGGKICQNFSKYSRLIFSFLSAFSEYHMQFSWWAYIYGMMAFWTIWCWYLVSDQEVKKTKWHKLILTISLILALLTHYAFIWVIGAFIIWSLFKENRSYLKISGIVVGFGITYLWLFKDILLRGSQNFYVDADSWNLKYFWGILGTFISGSSSRANWYTFWPLLVLILLLAIFWKEEKNKKYFNFCWWPWLTLIISLLMSFGVWVFAFKSPINQVRTLLPASIALMILESWYLGRLLEKSVYNRKYLWFLIIILIAFLGVNWKSYLSFVDYLKMDIQGRGAAKVLSKSEICSKDMEIKYYPPWLDLTFEYYLEKYSQRRCSIKKNEILNEVEGDKWWLLKSRYYVDRYYRNDKSINIRIEDQCPKVLFAWRGENEDLYLCGGDK